MLRPTRTQLHHSFAPGLAALTALMALTPTSLGQGAVHVVDDDGPAPFADIQSAIDAAADNDLILVRDGSYGFFAVDGKSLTIMPESDAASVVVWGPFLLGAPAVGIANLAAGQSVTVRGITVNTFGVTAGEIPLEVTDCAGPVLIEDCLFDTQQGDVAQVDGSATVVFTRCTLISDSGFFDSFESIWLTRHALVGTNSNLYVYDSTFIGPLGPDSDGQVFQILQPGNGGDALNLEGCTLYASGSTLLGGDGGSGVPGGCYDGGNAGDGIQFDAACTVRLLDTTTAAGVPGQPSPSCGAAAGNPGQDLNGPAGIVTQLAGDARSLDVGSPVVEGTSVPFTFTGQAGDTVLLVIGLEPDLGTYYPAFGVVQLVEAPWVLLPMGTIPAGGVLQANLPIPQLLPGVLFQRLPGQALMVGSGSTIFHAGPSSTVLLDASI